MVRWLIGLLVVSAGLAAVWTTWGSAADDSVAEPQAASALSTQPDAKPMAGVGLPAAIAQAQASSPSVDERQASEQARREQELAYWHDRLDGYRENPGNLQQFFNELLAQCGHEPDLCQALLEDRLDGYPDAAFADQLRQILAQQYGYEGEMQGLVMSTALPPQNRYQQLDALRVQHFGEAATEMLYGQERAWASYQFGYENLMEQAAYLSQDQRLQRLQQLRQDAWGDYGEALAEQEGRYGRYRKEQALLLAGVTDAAERDAISQALREKYFDPEQAELVAERERAREQQAQQQQDYDTAKQALAEDMANLKSTMTDSAWQQLYQQRLTELRQQVFK